MTLRRIHDAEQRARIGNQQSQQIVECDDADGLALAPNHRHPTNAVRTHALDYLRAILGLVRDYHGRAAFAPSATRDYLADRVNFRSDSATIWLVATKLSGFSEMESIPASTRNAANSG